MQSVNAKTKRRAEWPLVVMTLQEKVSRCHIGSVPWEPPQARNSKALSARQLWQCTTEKINEM
jgi:hypothetical protein